MHYLPKWELWEEGIIQDEHPLVDPLDDRHPPVEWPCRIVALETMVFPIHLTALCEGSLQLCHPGHQCCMVRHGLSGGCMWMDPVFLLLSQVHFQPALPYHTCKKCFHEHLTHDLSRSVAVCH